MRTTRKHIEFLVQHLRLVTGDDSYYIGFAYGRPRLDQRMDHGMRDISPILPTGELYRWIEAYIRGIEVGQRMSVEP